jgi:hypothetical protein
MSDATLVAPYTLEHIAPRARAPESGIDELVNAPDDRLSRRRP